MHKLIVDNNDFITNQILVTLLMHEAHVSSFKLSPYKFVDYGLQSIELTVDRMPAGKRLKFYFANKRYASTYALTVVNLGQLHSGLSNGVSYEDVGDEKIVFV